MAAIVIGNSDYTEKYNVEKIGQFSKTFRVVLQVRSTLGNACSILVNNGVVDDCEITDLSTCRKCKSSVNLIKNHHRIDSQVYFTVDEHVVSPQQSMSEAYSLSEFNANDPKHFRAGTQEVGPHNSVGSTFAWESTENLIQNVSFCDFSSEEMPVVKSEIFESIIETDFTYNTSKTTSNTSGTNVDLNKAKEITKTSHQHIRNISDTADCIGHCSLTKDVCKQECVSEKDNLLSEEKELSSHENKLLINDSSQLDSAPSDVCSNQTTVSNKEADFSKCITSKQKRKSKPGPNSNKRTRSSQQNKNILKANTKGVVYESSDTDIEIVQEYEDQNSSSEPNESADKKAKQKADKKHKKKNKVTVKQLLAMSPSSRKAAMAASGSQTKVKVASTKKADNSLQTFLNKYKDCIPGFSVFIAKVEQVKGKDQQCVMCGDFISSKVSSNIKTHLMTVHQEEFDQLQVYSAEFEKYLQEREGKETKGGTQDLEYQENKCDSGGDNQEHKSGNTDNKMFCILCDSTKPGLSGNVGQHIAKEHANASVPEGKEGNYVVGQEVYQLIQKKNLNLNVNTGLFQCFECETVCPTQQAILEHMKLEHRSKTEKEKAYICKICADAFGTYELLFKHCIEVHQSGRTQWVNCKFCGSRFLTSKELSAHESEVHSHGFRCPGFGCDVYHIDSKRKFLLHMIRTHFKKIQPDSDGPTTVLCTLCGEAFHSDRKLNTRAKLLRHFEANHQQAIGNQDLGVIINQIYACKVCGKKFLQGKTLREHEIIHGEIHCPYENCNKVYNRYKSMRNHLRAKHSKDGIVQCQYCGKNFSENQIKRHVAAVHEKLMDFKCPYDGCGKSFARNCYLTVHKRVHTGEKPFKCKYCDFAGAQGNNLRYHMKIHHLDKQGK